MADITTGPIAPTSTTLSPDVVDRAIERLGSRIARTVGGDGMDDDTIRIHLMDIFGEYFSGRPLTFRGETGDISIIDVTFARPHAQIHLCMP